MTKTYAQLTREIQALQASAEKLRAAEVKAVIAKLNESIAAYGLTADDLHFPGATSGSGGRRANSATTSSSRSEASTDAKYSDGQGNTWGGRGPRPAWLRQAILNGKSLESFETSDGAASSKGVRGANKTAGGNAKSSGASKIKLPPLYGHPKTGQTWSGRGPKPAWLKQGLKKRGASIDDFLISAQTSASAEAAAPAAAPAQSKSARAKPAATASSSAAKKSLGEKIASKSNSSTDPTDPIDSTPEAAAKSAPTAPAKKATAAGKTTAEKTKAVATPAKKVAVKPAAKPAGKPSAKKTSAPRKNLPSSMAPSADAAPTPSTVPVAAPMPAPLSDSIEGRGDTAGA